MTEPSFAKSFEEFAKPMIAGNKSPEETIAFYLSGVDALNAALNGLSDADLDLARAEGKWSIRQIAHHIVDGDDIWSMVVKAMIGNPGCTFVLDWYDQDPWVQEMNYRKRPVDVTLALFRARRYQIAEILHHVPDVWERSARIVMRQIPAGLQWTVAFTVLVQACHTLWHIEQIRQTRQVHTRL